MIGFLKSFLCGLRHDSTLPFVSTGARIVQHCSSGDFEANLIPEWCMIFQRLSASWDTALLEESRIS